MDLSGPLQLVTLIVMLLVVTVGSYLLGRDDGRVQEGRRQAQEAARVVYSEGQVPTDRADYVHLHTWRAGYEAGRHDALARRGP